MRRTLTPNSVRDLSRELHRLERRIAATKQVLVGLPSDAPNYPDGTNIIMVAAVNEFGSGHIPERSFLRKGIYSNAAKYVRLFKRAMVRILNGGDEDRELNLIGLEASQDVKKQIDATLIPANRPSTIARKGSSHPLIDTGHLRQQITWKVRRPQ